VWFAELKIFKHPATFTLATCTNSITVTIAVDLFAICRCRYNCWWSLSSMHATDRTPGPWQHRTWPRTKTHHSALCWGWGENIVEL